MSSAILLRDKRELKVIHHRWRHKFMIGVFPLVAILSSINFVKSSSADKFDNSALIVNYFVENIFYKKTACFLANFFQN